MLPVNCDKYILQSVRDWAFGLDAKKHSDIGAVLAKE